MSMDLEQFHRILNEHMVALQEDLAEDEVVVGLALWQLQQLIDNDGLM